MALGDEKYILLTTYRRDATPVATATWAVNLDGGAVGFWTSSGSGKAKRLARTTTVTVQPCDARGRVTAGSVITEGAARVVRSPAPEYLEIQTKIRAKYGFMTTITKFLNALGGIIKRKRIPYADVGVVITLVP